MKILIVDDEELIRKKLAQIITSSSLRFQKIIQAADVPEALQVIQEEEVEIVLTDISMPQHSGLEIAKYVYTQKLDSIVILVTGYADFEYAKTAIQYHVFDYILKPVDTASTIHCIERAKKQYQQNQAKKNSYKIFQKYFSDNYLLLRKEFLENLLFHPIEGNEALLQQQRALLRYPSQEFRLIVFRCMVAESETTVQEEYYYTHIIENYLQKKMAESILLSIGDTLYWVVPAGQGQNDKPKSLDALLSHLKRHIELSYPVTILIGVSCRDSMLARMKILKKQANVCLEYLQTHPGHDVVFYDDISDEIPITYDFVDLISQIDLYVQTGNTNRAVECMESFVKSMQSLSISQAQTLLRMLFSKLTLTIEEIGNKVGSSNLDFLEATQHFPSECQTHPCSPHSVSVFTVWIRDLCEQINGLLKNKNNVLVQTVLDYIDNHYAKQISLSQAAEYVHRNPSYISRLIKQYTSKNFTQLLTEKRIDAAKHLLKDSTAKIGTIAEQVGYPNLHYFTRIFLKYVGVTPNDYRKLVSTLIATE